MNNVKTIVAAITAAVMIFGCAGARYKGYNGPELPPGKVAIVKLSPELTFVGTDTLKPESPMRGATITLMPGMNIIKIGSTSSTRLVEETPRGTHLTPLSLLTDKLGASRVIDMNVEAGHTYAIGSKFTPYTGATPYTGRGITTIQSTYQWVTPVVDMSSGKEIEVIVFDGELKLGTVSNPRHHYRRK